MAGSYTKKEFGIGPEEQTLLKDSNGTRIVPAKGEGTAALIKLFFCLCVIPSLPLPPLLLEAGFEPVSSPTHTSLPRACYFLHQIPESPLLLFLSFPSCPFLACCPSLSLSNLECRHSIFTPHVQAYLLLLLLLLLFYKCLCVLVLANCLSVCVSRIFGNVDCFL